MSTNPFDDTQLAYFAGFFDGEGCITTSNGKKDLRYLVVTAAQVDPKPLNQLRQQYGGSIHRKRELGRRPCYSWRLTGRSARVFLEDIRPWLVVKAEQADLAIRLQRDIEESGRVVAGRVPLRAVLAREIRALKWRSYGPDGVAVSE